MCWVRNYRGFFNFLFAHVVLEGDHCSAAEADRAWEVGHRAPRLQELFCSGRAPVSMMHPRDLLLDKETQQCTGDAKYTKTCLLKILYYMKFVMFLPWKKSILWFYWIIKFSFVLDDTKILQSFGIIVVSYPNREELPDLKTVVCLVPINQLHIHRALQLTFYKFKLLVLAFSFSVLRNN